MLRRQVGGIHTKLLVGVVLPMAAAALCSAEKVTSEMNVVNCGLPCAQTIQQA
jgi:hypothetical protein